MHPHWLQKSFSKIKAALFKTRKDSLEEAEKESSLSSVERPDPEIEINNSYFENLHDHFIKADVGFDLTDKIILELKKQIKVQKINNSDLQNKIKEIIRSLLRIQDSGFRIQDSGFRIQDSGFRIQDSGFKIQDSGFSIFLIVGVNGSGKTTTIGKLAKRFKGEGLKVLIIAADTFRAAAGEQLDIWAKRAEVEIYAPPEIKKPDAVVFSGIEKAKKENYNLLLIDTAGRLQSQSNLMDELKKINTVIEKNASDATRENLIVLDATIGQNSITQAELFLKVTPLTGIILAKLDSSAKGGVVLNIMNKLSLPVKLIGTGEKIDDLVEFNLDEYLEGLIA